MRLTSAAEKAGTTQTADFSSRRAFLPLAVPRSGLKVVSGSEPQAGFAEQVGGKGEVERVPLPFGHCRL